MALPPQVLSEGSREALVALLEAAEDQLKCQQVIVVFNQDRTDKEKMLVRTFMFLGFKILPESSNLIPETLAKDHVCMIYNID